MNNKNEKELINHLSSLLKSNHTFENIKASNVTLKAPVKKSISKIKIALFTGIPTVAVLGGAIALLIVFGFSYKNVRPFEYGIFKDFSSFKGFGIGGKKIERETIRNRGINPRKIATNDGGYYDSPVKFYQLDSDNNYEEAIIYNENDKEINNYHIGNYEEYHDFILASIFNTNGPKIEYSVWYSYSCESNALPFGIEEKHYVSIKGTDSYQEGFDYLISKRTGKVYKADDVPENIILGRARGFGVLNKNFFAYEDGYLLGGSDLFLAKEEQEGFKFERILTDQQIQAMRSWGLNGDMETIHVDRYGNIYEKNVGAIINGEIYKENIYFDSYNNTIYKLVPKQNGKYDYYYLNQNSEFVLKEEIDSEKKEVLMELMGWGLGIVEPFLRGNNYLIMQNYKLTFDLSESNNEYRDYEITKLPIDLIGSLASQGNYLYILEEDQFYKLNCVTLEYDTIKVGGDDLRITEFSVEPNGDILLKGYSSDLKEITGYIIDGEFSYEKQATNDDSLVCYVRPLN